MHAIIEKFFGWLPIGSVPEIDVNEFKSLLKRKTKEVQLLDVRTPAEWQKGHIKGSLNVPLSILRKQIPALPYEKEKQVVVICYSANRSIPAVRVLSRAGFTNVTQLAGGVRRWEENGFPLKKES